MVLRNYVGGKTFLMGKCDPNDWSLQEVTFDLKQHDYKGSVQIFYRQLGIRLDKDLIKVLNDDGTRKIVKTAMDLIQKHVEVYINHTSHMTEVILLTIDEGG